MTKSFSSIFDFFVITIKKEQNCPSVFIIMPELTLSEITQKIQFLKLQIKDLENKIVIHKVLPKEIFVMILKKLCYKSINLARNTCSHWRNVIDSFNLVEEIWGKY